MYYMVFFTVNYLRHHTKVLAESANQVKDYIKSRYPTAKNVRVKVALIQG